MVFTRSRKVLIPVLVVVVIGIAAAAATPRMLEMTSTPGFCSSCHVMQEHYEAWFMTGVHRSIKCIDCHLPHDHLVNHLVWKGIEGTRDLLFFHSGFYTEPIRISERGRSFVQDNCVRCHAGVVSRIETSDQNCWSCHRRMTHKAAIFN